MMRLRVHQNKMETAAASEAERRGRGWWKASVAAWARKVPMEVRGSDFSGVLRLKLAMRSHQAAAKRLIKKATSSSSQGMRAWVRQACAEVAPRVREAWRRGAEV
jgi:hypothetical protein